MKLVKIKIEESEYQHMDEIHKEVCTKKYFLGFIISRSYEKIVTKIPPVTEIKRNTHRFGEVVLKEGMKVISRSNEPDPLMVGEIIGFETLNYKYNGNDAFPIVRDLSNGKEYMSMTILIPYSEELYERLQTMKPIEQYNYLVFPNGQIKEKYGIKYKTFK